MSNDNYKTVMIGENEIRFDFGVEQSNSYLDDMLPNSKVAPAWNTLVQCVADDDKQKMKELLLVNGKPNGQDVMAVMGALMAEFSTEAKITLKKPAG